MNLHLKLFLPFVILFTGFFFLSTFYVLPYYTNYLESEQINYETAQIELLSAALAPDIIEVDMAHISTSINEALMKRKHWYSLELFAQDGERRYPTKQVKIANHHNLTTISSSIFVKGQAYGSMTLHFDPRPGIEKPLNYAHCLYYAVLAILVLTFFAVGAFLDYLIRKPMIKLIKFADQIASGNYQGNAHVNSTDEVGQLGKSLEAMRQKIHQRNVAMNHSSEIQSTINFIQSKFISVQGDNHIFLELQSKILALTNSEVGLIGEIHKNNDQLLSCKALSLNDISNTYSHHNMINRALPEGNGIPALETLLGKIMTTGHPVIDKGPNLLTNQLGFPISGKPTVDNFLGLPLYSHHQLVGVLVLVNKKEGVGPNTFKELEVLLQTLAQLIVALRERKVLADNESRLRLLINSAVEGIISVNSEGIITGINKAAERIFGYTAKQLTGQSIGLLIPPENHFNHLDSFRFLLESENVNDRTNTEIETDALHRNGKLIPVELSFSRVTIDGNVLYTGVVRDITERKQHESELNKAYAELQKAHECLEQQNRIDPLTRLANRRHLDETLESEWKRAQRLDNSPLTIMLCDIDYFKKYNDAYGHLEGDDCLIKVAKVMAASFARKIDLVARYGGEEFMIILPNTPSESAVKQADIMRRRIWDLNIKHKSSPVADRVTISIGVYTVQQPSVNHKLKQAIQRTDEALYDAKDNGRNQVFCYEVTNLEA